MKCECWEENLVFLKSWFAGIPSQVRELGDHSRVL